jgi:hypothetical protein
MKPKINRAGSVKESNAFDRCQTPAYYYSCSCCNGWGWSKPEHDVPDTTLPPLNPLAIHRLPGRKA